MKTSITILGRPNVGKSSIFNRLIGRKKAIVLDTPGVTRDRIEGDLVLESSKTFRIRLMDTGGLGEGLFSHEIEKQVQFAAKNSHFIFWVIDGRSGVLKEDLEVLKWMRAHNLIKKVVGLVNKIDHETVDFDWNDLHKTGVSQWFPISAEHNIGFGEVREWIEEQLVNLKLEDPTAAEDEESSVVIPKVVIVGKPNVGKSTLLNKLVGFDRQVVSTIAGTTSDAIEEACEIQGRTFLFKDTAGIRRKGKTNQGIEVLSVVQTRKALEDADLALFLIDAEEGVHDQDEKIAGLIEEAGTSCIVVINKWDLHQISGFSKKNAIEQIHDKMKFFKYAPIIFASAQQGTGLGDLADLMLDVIQQRQQKILTRELTKAIRDKLDQMNPFGLKFYLAQQVSKKPPTFVFRVNKPSSVHFSLKRHLVHFIRETWGFMGTPIKIEFLPRK